MLFPLIFSFVFCFIQPSSFFPLLYFPLIVLITGHRPKWSPAPNPSVLFLPIWKSISDADEDVEALYKCLVILVIYKCLVILLVYSQLCDTLSSYEQWYVSCPPSCWFFRGELKDYIRCRKQAWGDVSIPSPAITKEDIQKGEEKRRGRRIERTRGGKTLINIFDSSIRFLFQVSNQSEEKRREECLLTTSRQQLLRHHHDRHSWYLRIVSSFYDLCLFLFCFLWFE